MHTSRQRSVRFATVAISIAALSACGGGSKSSSTTAAGQSSSAPATTGPVATESGAGGANITVAKSDKDPVKGGTLRYGLEADVAGLNPAKSALSAPGLQMAHAVFDTLATADADGNWKPWLAESFSPNADFTVWTMKLRPNVTFHDGEPLNADAAVQNFEAQRNDPLVGLAVKPFFPEQGGAVKVDEMTVEYHPLDANSQFPILLSEQLGMVASPKWLAAAKDDGTLNQQPVGTGPFKFASRNEDSVTKFVRNDAWWAGDVYLDAVEFYPVTDSDDRTDLLLSGDLEALHTTVADSIEKLQKADNIESLVNTKSEESFAMMNTSQPPFNDIRARQALTYAAPVNEYVQLIGRGIAPAADQMFIPESRWYNPDVKQEGNEAEKAEALVKAYCDEHGTDTNPVLKGPTCTDGKINVELQWSGPSKEQTQIAELLNAGWKPYFNVTFDEKLQDDHIKDAAFGQYNVATWRQFGGFDPSYDNVWLMCRSIGDLSLNWPRLCDESRDKLLLEAMATDDQETRIAKYQELSQKLHDDYIYIFFIHTAWDNAFSNKVHGVCDRKIPDTDTTAACSANGHIWLGQLWMES